MSTDLCIEVAVTFVKCEPPRDFSVFKADKSNSVEGISVIAIQNCSYWVQNEKEWILT